MTAARVLREARAQARELALFMFDLKEHWAQMRLPLLNPSTKKSVTGKPFHY